MPQILRIPVDLEPQMITRVYHLMRHRILHLALRLQVICVQLNSIRLVKPAVYPRLAPSIADVVLP
jgi:hypothetical protein